jgi:glycosyltransferase involved in cell wall biosynthesis
MKKLFLSVVITTYNRANLLKSCLISFATQTLSKDLYEIVVVDDGSSDHTEKVCRDLSKALPLNYLKQKHSGIMAAKNLGILSAQGKIILLFDDDAVAEKNLLLEHLNFHQKNPEENAAALGFTDWSPHLKINPLMYFITHLFPQLLLREDSGPREYLNHLEFWNSSLSYKKLLLVMNGRLNREMSEEDFILEDLKLNSTLLAYGLKVTFCKNMIHYINRQITYDDFCERCEKAGSAWAKLLKHHFREPSLESIQILSEKGGFKEIKSYPEIKAPGYLDIHSAAEKWKYVKLKVKEKVDQVHNLEIDSENFSSLESSRVLELFKLYEWSFKAFLLKGYVQESKKQNMEKGGSRQDKVSTEDLNYFTQKHKTISPIVWKRGNVLMIAPYLPNPGLIPGSLRLLHILLGISSLNYHTAFISRSPAVAKNYLSSLQNKGIETYAGDPLALENANMPIIIKYLNLKKIFSRRVYVLVILSSEEIINYYYPLIKKISPTAKIVMDVNDFSSEIPILKKADMIWTSSLQTKQNFQNEIPEIPAAVIPNVHEKITIPRFFEQTSDLLCAGNFYDETQLRDLQSFCREVFPLILNVLPNIKLHILGNCQQNGIKSNFSEKILIHDYPENWSPLFLNSRVFVSPSSHFMSREWIGESLAHGTPVVTPLIHANSLGLVHGRDLLAAENPQQFASNVIRVYQDPTLWKFLSKNGKMKAETEWSPEVLEHSLKEIFDSAAYIIRSQGRA